MQTTVIYFGLAINWLLLIVSILLAVFSKFKHTQFKQGLYRFLNMALIIQVVIAIALVFSSTAISGLITLSWLVIGLQLVCNVICYKSVKRRQARVKPSLDHFSMD
ncbi:hypothetical protein [Pseudoalteromonas sp. DL-6]|uniref:hypothetical protein n=1 Tax=Pseudoalteromonas sp. DL-6 TaxID=1390185 RepID=UPI00103D87C6|nr:hypothetical protein [Pseudoalteromonas sp. DL-6]QBJ63112.1 hypothetical protein B1F84_08685 [Pseudoalteromonas sp. DL-6]